MNIPDLNKLKGSQLTEKYFKCHYLEFLNFINNKFPTELSFQEKLYWYYHNLKNCPTCKMCGRPTKFINSKLGYRIYCSRKCLNSDPDKKEKFKQTCIEKFGNIAPACSNSILNKIKQTNIERYGTENAMQNKNIANKSHQTNIERYGGCGNASKILFEKQKQTNIERYGVENVMQNTDIKNKTKITRKQTLKNHYNDIMNKIIKSRQETEINKHNDLIGYTKNGDWMCKCPHSECNKCKEKYYITKPQIFDDRFKDYTELCTRLLPIGLDNTKNTSIELFIQNILDEYKIQYLTNVRNIIPPKELDIYIPNKKIAIECNGVYSHSSKYKPNNYHINKTKECNLLGIQLLHIWEDWIKTKPEIIKSIILNKLGLTKNIIYARKCRIEICNNKKEYLKFLDDNHIQGRSLFKIAYGLRYNNELVSIMTFGSRRALGSNKSNETWELIRFCNKINTSVIGGASKLFKHFVYDINPHDITSFSSNDISNGNLYKQLNFKLCELQSNSYWYIKPKTLKRYHRTSFTKQAIKQKGLAPNKDNWTESEAMNLAGYFKIFDSGQTKWVWERQ